MDIFKMISGLEGVKRVSNLYPEICQKTINLIFFVCPATKSRLKVNRNRTGFTTCYKQDGAFGSVAWKRVQKVREFLLRFRSLELDYSCVCIFASGDALIISSLPVEAPVCLESIDGIEIVSNYKIVHQNLTRFSTLYGQKPWENVPVRTRNEEEVRLWEILPKEAGDNLKTDFVERIWAGFALDGILIREGTFGINPVILGVESPGVAMLQNSALEKKNWIPVIHL
jgi:hypothetical protein